MNPFDHGSDSSDDDRNVLIRSQRRRGTKEEGLSDKAERESVAAAAEEAIRWMTQAAGDIDRKTASETKMGVEAEAGRECDREVASRRESLSMYSVERERERQRAMRSGSKSGSRRGSVKSAVERGRVAEVSPVPLSQEALLSAAKQMYSPSKTGSASPTSHSARKKEALQQALEDAASPDMKAAAASSEASSLGSPANDRDHELAALGNTQDVTENGQLDRQGEETLGTSLLRLVADMELDEHGPNLTHANLAQHSSLNDFTLATSARRTPPSPAAAPQPAWSNGNVRGAAEGGGVMTTEASTQAQSKQSPPTDASVQGSASQAGEQVKREALGEPSAAEADDLDTTASLGALPGHALRLHQRDSAKDVLAALMEEIQACAHGMQRHVDANVVRGPGSRHLTQSELLLSKLTVSDISGWVSRISSLTQDAKATLSTIECRLPLCVLPLVRACHASMIKCTCCMAATIQAELSAKDQAIKHLVEDAQRREVCYLFEMPSRPCLRRRDIYVSIYI